MASVNQIEFKFSRPTGKCAATGRELQPGERCMTVLVETVGGGATGDDMGRLDYSIEAWEGGSRPAEGTRVFGSWRTTVPESGEKPRRFIDDAALFDLFEQLGEATDRRRQAFRYILGLILIRKRLLVYEGTRGSSLLVRAKGAEKDSEDVLLWELVDPGLDDQTLAEASEQVEAVLSGDGSGGAAGGEL